MIINSYTRNDIKTNTHKLLIDIKKHLPHANININTYKNAMNTFRADPWLPTPRNDKFQGFPHVWANHYFITHITSQNN